MNSPSPKQKLTLLLASCAFLSTPNANATPEKIVIWKLDDVRASQKTRLAPGFKRVADWAKQNNTVVTMGIICDSLTTPNADDVSWIKTNAIENGGCIEFWMHGLDHKTAIGSDGIPTYEFKGPDLDTQSKHLREACAIFTKTTGLTFRVFGAPNNQTDHNTPAAMDQTPELSIWMYGPAKDDAKKRTVIPRSLNMEVSTGKVSYDKFVDSYKAKPTSGPLLLQGHCGMWNDQSYSDFIKIADFLAKEGWTTKTSAQYVEALRDPHK